MTQKDSNWVTLTSSPSWRYSQAHPLFCKSDKFNTKFILFTPHSFDKCYCLYRYNFHNDKFSKFAEYDDNIELSSHFYNQNTNEIYVFGSEYTPLFGIYNNTQNQWKWDINKKYKKWCYAMGFWIYDELHLYSDGYHAKYVPSTKQFIIVNDEQSFLYNTVEQFRAGVGQALQSTDLQCINMDQLLLLPSDRRHEQSPIYMCSVNSTNQTEFEWIKCTCKLPQQFVFGGCSKTIVALQYILIIFEEHTDNIWFCDLKDFSVDKEYEWIKTEFRHKLPADNLNERDYRIGMHVVLSDTGFHFLKGYETINCGTFHIKMDLFQLFPQQLLDKYVLPLICGYLRHPTLKLPHDVNQLIYSFCV